MATQVSASPPDFPPCVQVLGSPIHIVEVSGVLPLMEKWIAEGTRTRWIAVTGSHGVLEAHKHPEFKEILKSADLSVPDGRWAARAASKKASSAPKQVRGANLLEAFCDLSARKGYTNFFYGDTEEVLALASRRLTERHPGVKIVGTCSPPFRELSAEEDRQVVEAINRASPDVLWVGLGLPKQEKWIYTHRERLNARVMVAVGAALKFVSGKIEPAPRWVSDSGLEWLWRFAHEPRRLWHRVVVYGPQFMLLTLLELYGLKKFR